MAWSAASIAAPTTLRAYGGPAPDFTLEMLAEEAQPAERMPLARLEGRVVIVHFFATWCEPCREELPALVRLAGRFRAHPLAVIGVDVGEVDARVRRFLSETPVPFPVLMDRDRAVTKAWQISALPSTVVLDAALAPRFIAEGDVDWDRREADAVLFSLMGEETPGLSNTIKQSGGSLP